MIRVTVSHHARRTAALTIVTLLPLAAIGCGSGAAGEKPDPGKAKSAAAAAPSRPAASITLAASDVATVAPATIEDGVALTGDLNPIETVEVHARIEGDLTGVYVREGQQVSAGQLLARFESSEQESTRSSAEADRVAAQSDLANAQWTLDQNAQLFKAGAMAEQTY